MKFELPQIEITEDAKPILGFFVSAFLSLFVSIFVYEKLINSTFAVLAAVMVFAGTQAFFRYWKSRKQ